MVLLIIILIYSLSIFYFALVFVLSKNEIHQEFHIKTVSILIPFKNEENNLLNLITDLENLSYQKDKLEIIFINDNSTDKSIEIVERAISNKQHIRVINLINETGKKQALKKGLKFTKGEIIVHTDADVKLHKEWINIIVSSFENKEILLCFGSVVIDNEKNVFEKLQSLELLSLSGIAASTGIIKHPVLISGANLAYRKEIKQDFINSINTLASGDDMFFLEEIKKKYPKSIKYIQHPNNIVLTNAERNVNSFLNQRLRWAGKTKKIKDFEILFMGSLSGLSNISILILLVILIFNNQIINIFLISLVIKFLFEAFSISIYAIYFKKIKLITLFPLLFVLYPFYITGVSTISLFVKAKWK